MSISYAKRKTGQRRGRQPETRHVGIRQIPLCDLRPSPENDQLYRPIDPTDPEIKALAASIAEHGVLEPLVVTQDAYVISGHRRLAAAKLAGLETVPCRVEPIRRRDNLDAFVRLLATYNQQRVKNFSETLREQAATTNTADAYERLLSERAERSVVTVPTLKLERFRARAKITSAKTPMLEAVELVLDDRREFWPLSDRQIHYALLNDPPLRHASKKRSRYANDRQSYGDLCDLLTRARLCRLIPWEAIADETRPVVTWSVWQSPQPFLCEQFSGLLKGYWRDLQQSQPNHIEVVIEKNTAASICNNVCGKYCLPMTSGRGFCSLPPRYDMAQRYRKSGKDKLVLLIVSDCDPEGEVIAESFARSMRDDFDVDVRAVKVALTAEQAAEFNLPTEMVAKAGSVHRTKYVAKHGENVWEVEALPPDDLQRLLEEAILSVLDVDAYNHEVEREREDAAEIEATRKAMRQTLPDIAEGK